MFDGLCIRGFARDLENQEFHNRCIPGFPGFLGRNHARTPCTFCTFGDRRGKYAKSVRSSALGFLDGSLCIRGFAWEIEQTSDTKVARREIIGFPRIPREKVIFGPAALPFLDFRGNSGFPASRKGWVWPYSTIFLLFFLWKSRKVYGVLEFWLFQESRNPFVTDLTLQRYFFGFQERKSSLEFFKNIEKLEATRLWMACNTASATERSLW